eukprot:2611174-Amphidinium_carterae.1
MRFWPQLCNEGGHCDIAVEPGLAARALHDSLKTCASAMHSDTQALLMVELSWQGPLAHGGCFVEQSQCLGRCGIHPLRGCNVYHQLAQGLRVLLHIR